MAHANQTQQVAESILRFFPGFEAFKLPPPSVDEEVMKNINRNRSQVNTEFFSGIEQLKSLLKRTLAPKHSFNDGEIVTGEGRAYSIPVNEIISLMCLITLADRKKIILEDCVSTPKIS